MNSRQKKKIINNIAECIEMGDYTKSSLCKAAGIPYASLTNIFTRGTMPGIDIILKMCNTMKVSPTMLLTGLSDEAYLKKCNQKEGLSV